MIHTVTTVNKREQSGWTSEPAQEGDTVMVRNCNGRAWRWFTCKRAVDGSLYFAEMYKGEARKLVGISCHSIGYEYQGIKHVHKPKPYRDVLVKFRGIWFYGYYCGDGEWRVYTSNGGDADTYTKDIEAWKPED